MEKVRDRSYQTRGNDQMRVFAVLLLAVLLLTSVTLYGQTPTTRGNPPAAQTASKLAGSVTDPSGAVMLGAEIKIYQGNNLIKEAKTDDRGGFSFDVPPGQYRVDVTAPDFRPFSAPLRVVANMPRVTIQMALAAVNTSVDVGSKKDE